MEEEEELDWLDERLASKPRKRKKKKNINSNTTDVKRKKANVPDDNHNNNFECDICSKRFPKKYYLEKHKRVHSTDELKCELCPYVTNVKQKLNRHVKRIHERIRPVKCPHCYMMFEYKCQMEHHKLVHTGEKPYECEVCGKAFNSQYSLRTHNFIHTNEKPFQCKYCPYACRDASTLRKHHNMHVGDTTQAYQCNLCGLKLKCKSNLKMHVAEKHLKLDVKIHHCTYCDRRFKEKSALNIHIKAVHLKADFVHCDICSKRIARKCNLKAHMRSHDNYRQFVCAVDGCHRRFKSKSDLKKHEIVHEPAKHFPCDICGRRFAREYRMRSHLINIHGPQRPRKRFRPHQQKPIVTSYKTSYQCNSCGFLSGNKPGLISHMKQKEQKCTICNWTFCGSLQLHKHNQDMHTERIDDAPASDRDRDILEIKQERDDTKSIDLFEIEKEEPLDDLFYAGSEVDDGDASELSKVQEAMKRMEDTKLSVDLQDIPEAVFDQFYTQHVDTVSDTTNYDSEHKVHTEYETNHDSLDPHSNLNVKLQSFIETPKIVNKRLEIVKKLDRNSFKQKSGDRLINTACPENISNQSYDDTNNFSKETVSEETVEITENIYQYNTFSLLATDTAEKVENKETAIEKQMIESEEEQLNENKNYGGDVKTIEDNEYSASSDNQKRGESQETEIRNSDEQINMEEAKTIKEYENSEPTAKPQKQNKTETNETGPNLNRNQNISSCGKSLDPELENISKEEFVEIVKLNVCNLKGIPDHLFDKFFIKHTDKVVREYKYSRHNTYDPNYKPTKAENKPQSIVKRHNNNTKKIKKNAIEADKHEKVSMNKVNNSEIQETNDKSKASVGRKDIKRDKKQSTIELEESNIEIKSKIDHYGADNTKTHGDFDVVCNKNYEQKKNSTNNSKAGYKTQIKHNNAKQNSKVSTTTDYFDNELSESSKVKTLKTLSLMMVANLMQISQYYQQTKYGTRRKRYNYSELFKDTLSEDEDTILYSEETAKEKSMLSKENIIKNKKSKLSKKKKNINDTSETRSKDDTDEKPKSTCIKRKVKTSKKRKPPKETYKSKCMPNSHQCYVCFKLFDSKESLMDHSKDHFNVSNTKSLKKCPLCEYICRNGLPRHMRLVHNMEIANKYSMTNMKCKKDESGVDRYYIEGDKIDFNEIEVFPSVKNLNRTKIVNIDKKNREENNKLIAKVKLVKKKDWIVEKEKLDVEMIVPNDNMKEKFTDDNEYTEKMRNLYQAAKKEGKVMMFPCRYCEKICQTLSALKLHFRKHDPNKKPFAPKIWKFKRNKSNRGNTEVENDNNITEKGDTATEDKGTSSVEKTRKSTEKTVADSEHVTGKAGRKKVKNPHNRDDKPKPIEHNHKCDPELKSFYENCIRGSDIEFWQFLKIYNKMGRENVKDFSDLDREDNTFGCHSLNDAHIGNSSTVGQEKSKMKVNYKRQEQIKSTISPKPATKKNIDTKSKSIDNIKLNKSTHSEDQIKLNVANKVTKTTKVIKRHATKINKGGKNNSRVVRISKKEYLKRQALKDMLRKRNAVH